MASRQKELFPRIKLKELSEEDIEALAVKHCGNLYYYFPEEVKELALAIERELKGINEIRTVSRRHT